MSYVDGAISFGSNVIRINNMNLPVISRQVSVFKDLRTNTTISFITSLTNHGIFVEKQVISEGGSELGEKKVVLKKMWEDM